MLLALLGPSAPNHLSVSHLGVLAWMGSTPAHGHLSMQMLSIHLCLDGLRGQQAPALWRAHTKGTPRPLGLVTVPTPSIDGTDEYVILKAKENTPNQRQIPQEVEHEFADTAENTNNQICAHHWEGEEDKDTKQIKREKSIWWQNKTILWIKPGRDLLVLEEALTSCCFFHCEEKALLKNSDTKEETEYIPILSRYHIRNVFNGQ